jgi:integrase
MNGKPYRFEPRPLDTAHGHPFLIFDTRDQLHFHLTVFAKTISHQVSESTVRVYLYALLPFFTFLDIDPWQIRSMRRWDQAPEQIRVAINDYLIQHFHCRIRDHHRGFQLIARTKNTQQTGNTIRLFLSALKLFYQVMLRTGYYRFSNPLIEDSLAAIKVAPSVEEQTAFPRMPAISGVEEPIHKRRLSNNYFKQEGEEWTPKIIDDPTLPQQILSAGRKIGWKLRELCVGHILFESGGRISEIVGLTIGDWVGQGALQEAATFSKGSYGKRVKTLRFSSETAHLLREYVRHERIRFDPHRYGLDQYLLCGRQQQQQRGVLDQPLFLTSRGTALSPKNFRQQFWNPACQEAGLKVNIHQARHWFVTMVVRSIYEQAANEGDVQRGMNGLLGYMRWRSGKEMLAVYQHYHDITRFIDIQEHFYAWLKGDLKQAQVWNDHSEGLQQKDLESNNPLVEVDIGFLRRIGGSDEV